MRTCTITQKTLTMPVLCSGVLLLIACGENPAERARPAQLQLAANEVGALELKGCEDTCPTEPLPNPLGCDAVEASIGDDGQPQGLCRREGDTIDIERFADLGLLGCSGDEEHSAWDCVDAFAEMVFTVDRAGVLSDFRRLADEMLQVPDSGGQRAEDVGQRGDETGRPVAVDAGDSDECLAAAQQKLAERINAVLAEVGLDLVYEPDTTASGPMYGALSGLLGGQFWRRDEAQNCEQSEDEAEQTVPQGALLPDKGDGEDEGPAGGEALGEQPSWRALFGADRPYCSNNSLGVDLLRTIPQQDRPSSGTAEGFISCRCAAMAEDFSNELTCDTPQGCDADTWLAALRQAAAAAARWLNSQVMRDLTAGTQFICVGSPLVLDLADDGIALTSLQRGVRFDLTGHGASQTAWVAGGDEALLAIDRDGNGAIDSGRELFGEAENLVGGRSPDGFEALALLDQPALGGNADGVVDREDEQFERLRLWIDRNGDGRGQSAELMTLEEGGIMALPLQSRRTETLIDEHGNDLSLRGRFIRSDGRVGLMVDVYLVSGSHR